MSVGRRPQSIAGDARGLFVATTAAIGFSLTAFAPELGIGRAGPGTTTLETALIQAYQNNPQLNAQRAATRATDENVPTALSGYRPRISGTSSLTEQHLDFVTKSSTPRGAVYPRTQGTVAVPAAGLTVSQTLYNGFQTANLTRQAESQVFAARETLRTIEQNTLLNAATAYMNLLQTAAILELQRSNVIVLETMLQQTRDRFSNGEVTRSDVAQAESSLAAGKSQRAVAESNYIMSKAQYRQVIGVDPPRETCGRDPSGSVDPAHARGIDRARPQGAPDHCHGDVQRRCRDPSGQDCRGRALSHPVRNRQRAEKLGLDLGAHGDGTLVSVGCGPASGPAIPGRCGIRRHPPGEGNARTAAP
jgi:outer membrane protein TolC